MHEYLFQFLHLKGQVSLFLWRRTREDI